MKLENKEYNDFFCYCRDGKINKVKANFKEEFLDGIKINGKCYENPLLISAVKNHKKVFNYLLSKGANTNIFLNDARAYLMPLISKLLKYQFDTASSEYFNTDEGFEETDEDEIEKGFLKLFLDEIYYIETLVNHGASVNSYSEEEGHSVLDTAYIYRNKHAYKLLQEKGSFHSKRFLEIYSDNLDDSKFLLENKMYIETTYIVEPCMPNIHKLLHREIENKNKYNDEITLDFLKILLQQSNDPNEKDYLGRTAIDYAIELGHTLAVDYLRSVGGKTSKELEGDNNDSI